MIDLPAAGTIVAYLDLLRIGLFFSCIGYALLLRAWLRPDADAFRRACMAALAQFWVGLLADILIVRLGFWSYRAMPFSLQGVPIDLHIDWALIWGFGLVWLADRVLGGRPRPKAVLLFLAAWTLFTLAFDAFMAESMLFLEGADARWWVADLFFLFTVQGFTLWFYHSVNRSGPAAERDERRGTETMAPSALPPIHPFLRSLVYLSLGVPFFYLYLPDLILKQAARLGLGAPPDWASWWNGLDSWRLYSAGWLVLAGVLLGGTALWRFAAEGGGTPIPFDPPRRLVTRGPYAYTANPMQQSGLLWLTALLILRPDPLLVVYALNIVVTVLVTFRVFETRTLDQRFPGAYAAYSGEVRPWRWRLKPAETDA